MSDLIMSDEFQAVSAVCVGLAGLLLLQTGLQAHRFNRYGREALVAASVFFLVAAAVRFLVIAGVVDSAEARAINAFVALVILLLIGQAAYLGHTERKIDNGNTHG